MLQNESRFVNDFAFLLLLISKGLPYALVFNHEGSCFLFHLQRLSRKALPDFFFCLLKLNKSTADVLILDCEVFIFVTIFQCSLFIVFHVIGGNLSECNPTHHWGFNKRGVRTIELIALSSHLYVISPYISKEYDSILLQLPRVLLGYYLIIISDRSCHVI